MICSTTYRTVLSLAGSLIMTLGAFSVLQASAAHDAPRVEVVRYADVNLTLSADVTRLYKRIRGAAARVCEPLGGRDLSRQVGLQRCIDEAVTAAVIQVNHPRLQALHSATIGGWQAASERRAKRGV